MASVDQTQATDCPSLRNIRVTTRPESRFPVPKSDGYSVYGALLSVLSSVDESVGERIHESSLGSLNNSGLLGPRGDSDRRHHKTLLPNETYELQLGIVHEDDQDVFQALVNALVLEGETIELSHGSLRIEEFESSNTTHQELLDRASEYDDPELSFTFETPTCIKEAGEITTMFPHRGVVFSSLLGKWNTSAPDELELDLTRDEIEANVIEKPDARSYRTHSVLVNRSKRDDGKTRNTFRQGFSGDCSYEMKDASESVTNAVTALAMFGEYSGVGSAVARGCGNLNTEIKR